MMDVEQAFETYLRRIERKLIDTREALNTRQVELAKLANLADQRTAAAQAEIAAQATTLAARDHELSQIREQMEQQITKARKDRDVMTTKAVQMSDKIANLEQTLEDMQQSRSWRLTRPLRWFSDPKGGR